MLPPEGALPLWRVLQDHSTNPRDSPNAGSNDFPTPPCFVYPTHVAAQCHERHDDPLCHPPFRAFTRILSALQGARTIYQTLPTSSTLYTQSRPVFRPRRWRIAATQCSGVRRRRRRATEPYSTFHRKSLLVLPVEIAGGRCKREGSEGMGTADCGVSLFAGTVALGGPQGRQRVPRGWWVGRGASFMQICLRSSLEPSLLSKLVEPINQTTETESLIPGLCAFLLGLCYEFNREPGEITRYGGSSFGVTVPVSSLISASAQIDDSPDHLSTRG